MDQNKKTPQQTTEEQEDNYSDECEDARNLYPLDPQMLTDEEEAAERALAQWSADFRARNPDYNPLSAEPKKDQSKQDDLPESEPIEPHEITSGMTADQMEKLLDRLFRISLEKNPNTEEGRQAAYYEARNLVWEELRLKQLQMVEEWEDRTGLESSAATMILGLYNSPMTKGQFLFEEGYEMSPSSIEDCPELLAELPEWYEQLPDELPE